MRLAFGGSQGPALQPKPTSTSVTICVMKKLFISYSHKDERWLTRLLVHLRPIERAGRLDLWADTRISPGEQWNSTIASALADAQLAVLLVSADFLASEFIASKELPPLLRAAQARKCRVLSVIVGPCLFSRIQDLQQFQAINSPGRPLTRMKKAEAEETLARAAVAILDHLSEDDVARDKLRSDGTSAHAPAATEPRPAFVGEPQVDLLISNVKLADWDAAEEAALSLVAATSPSGKNETFESLLGYRDCHEDDERLPGALQTIECCAHLAPWLINHEQLAQLAAHENSSVRSTAASICMDLAHSCPELVPLNLLLKLSVYDEDWYVQAPANAALKAMARSFPAVLRIFHRRLHSDEPDEAAHAAAALMDVAMKEPELLDASLLRSELRQLKRRGYDEAGGHLTRALSRLKGVSRTQRFRYGL